VKPGVILRRELALVVGVGLTALHGVPPTAHAAPRDSGVRVSIQLLKAAYVRNELTRVTLVATNTTKQPAMLLDTCPYGVLRLQVRNTAGQLVYPPVLAHEPTAHCGGVPAVVRLGVGQTLRRAVNVVLRGRILLPVVTVVQGNRPPVIIQGRERAVSLRSGIAPHVTFDTMTRGVLAVVSAAGGQTGKLLYRYWVRCNLGSQVTESASGAGYAWTAAGGAQVWLDYSTASCTPNARLEWHGLAGWVGRPVASINYSRH
jgi:hypothetical protein